MQTTTDTILARGEALERLRAAHGQVVRLVRQRRRATPEYETACRWFQLAHRKAVEAGCPSGEITRTLFG